MTLIEILVVIIVIAILIGQVVSRFSRSALSPVMTAVVLFAGDTVFSQAYQRDSLDRVTVLDERCAWQTTRLEYEYDENGRLASVARNGQLEAVYEFDPNGNLLSVTTGQGVQAGTYDARDRLVSLTDGQAGRAWGESGTGARGFPRTPRRPAEDLRIRGGRKRR
jgi:YD repeat-containing protein